MKALAELLLDRGFHVTGSDVQTPSPSMQLMQRRGLRVHQGHQDQFVPKNVDLLVYSPAVAEENPERQRARKLGIPELSYAEMLGCLMQDCTGVSIAGTHGKSTTTAMVASILSDAGLSPSAIVGAELCGRKKSGWSGEGGLFVVESCEYQRSFLQLSPSVAAILSIETDHFDYFANLEETIEAFGDFAERIPSDGCLLIPGHCAASKTAAARANAEVLTFDLESTADWWAADLRPTQDGTRFRIFYREKYFTEATLPIPGKHNVVNALAAAAISHRLGVDAKDVRESLREFRGIRRRFERVGSWRGVTLIDDFAHHPTAVKATLRTAREQFAQRRIWCVFQPHQGSRIVNLMDEFAESLTLADKVVIAPIYAAREHSGVEAGQLEKELCERAISQGVDCRFVPSLDRMIATLEDETRPGDVLITMGAGDIDRVQHEFTRRLQRDH